MPRYLINIEYDGTGLAGWQRQHNHATIQEYIEQALSQLTQSDIKVTASGRTDAGVHAICQTAHFDLDKHFPIKNIIHGGNYYLRNKRIRILSAEETSDQFHARFSAKQRHYKYIIVNREASLALYKNLACWIKTPLDIEAMQEAANYLLGTHDLTSFRASICQANSPIRTINHLSVTKSQQQIYINISALSFLHHMVRNIAGTLIEVGQHKRSAQEMNAILTAKDRSRAGPTAPACGLYFLKTDY